MFQLMFQQLFQKLFRQIFRRFFQSTRHLVSWTLFAIAAATFPRCTAAANHVFANTDIDADADAGTETTSDSDMQDLKTWLAAARRQTAASIAAPSPADADRTSNQMQTPIQLSTQPRPPEAMPAGQRIATRDPFVKLLLKVAAPSSVREIPAKETALHLLGTVRDGNTAYALIRADRQVLCIASNTSLPSYAIKVTSITDHAIALDRLLPDGSHQLSTLRLGE